MAQRIDLTLDCADARVVAPFWKLVLGYVDEPPPAPFKSRGEWLASFGEEDDGTAAWLCDPAGLGPRLSILPVPEGKIAKNRLHMDVRVSGEGTEDERWARVTAMVAAASLTPSIFTGSPRLAMSRIAMSTGFSSRGPAISEIGAGVGCPPHPLESGRIPDAGLAQRGRRRRAGSLAGAQPC